MLGGRQREAAKGGDSELRRVRGHGVARGAGAGRPAGGDLGAGVAPPVPGVQGAGAGGGGARARARAPAR